MNSNKLKFYVLAISCLSLINCRQSQNDTVSLKEKKLNVNNDEIIINEKTIDSLIIDLNNDGKLDKIEVKEKNNAERSVVVKIRNEKGYAIISNNNEIIGCEKCGYQGGDPYISLNIINKGFEIELEYTQLSFYYESNAIYLKKVDVLKTEATETGINENHEIYTDEQFGKIKLSDLKKDFILDLRKKHEKKENNIEGLYVLNSCENGRFKISIIKIGSVYTYSILDGKKIISRGNVSITSEDGGTIVSFGNIGGLYVRNNITVQNYGNSMNEYNHFTQCNEKYLTFEKVKK
jgi:hypothetical protein